MDVQYGAMKKTKNKAQPTRHKPKSASRKAVPRARGTAKDDVDGCDVAVTKATLDHDLPAAKGGVARHG
jgi:hypothetical protein